MRVDHVAIESRDIAASVQWYAQRFAAQVLYQDESWAFLRIGGIKLALVTPGAHPSHLAFSVIDARLDELAVEYAAEATKHRDGTRSIYIQDPSGNAVEFISYPEGHAYSGDPSGSGKAGALHSANQVAPVPGRPGQ